MYYTKGFKNREEVKGINSIRVVLLPLIVWMRI